MVAVQGVLKKYVNTAVKQNTLEKRMEEQCRPPCASGSSLAHRAKGNGKGANLLWIDALFI
jgi:hypothetical protein